MPRHDTMDRETLQILKTRHAPPLGEPGAPRRGDGDEADSVNDSLVERIASPKLLSRLARLPLTDAGNAESFYTMHRDNFRHVRTQRDGGGHWLAWEGHRWAEDRRGQAYRAGVDLARARLAAAAGIEDNDLRKRAVAWARVSERKYGLEAVLDLARVIVPQYATLPEDYDRSPWLLACKNGVLELRTGRLRDGKPGDNITLSTGLEYDPEATAPRWEKFLLEVFADDSELVTYVQRAVGYSLTGCTRDPAIFLCWGTGRNGKTTLLNALRQVVGDYGCNTPFTTFEAHDRSGISNDLAALAGKRIVTASETPERCKLNEARIRAMTGQDPITARFLFHELQTFAPTFHVWLAMSRKPTITGTDLGIWSRIKLLPFRICFAGNEDINLPLVLESELPGILAWAVRGCLLWQEEGLHEAPAVRVATETYRAESDSLKCFVADCCVLQKDAFAPAGALREAYEGWAKANGEIQRNLLGGSAWGERLRELGCSPDRAYVAKVRVRGWSGIGLVSESEDKKGAAE